MIAIFAINIIFVVLVLAVIVGLKAWAIHSARPSLAAPAPAHNPRVREPAVRARVTHGERAGAARSSSRPAGVRA